MHCQWQSAIELALRAVQEPIWAPTLVKALEGKEVAAVRPGQHHTLFLAASGALLSAGRPTYGRLGRMGLNTASDDAAPDPAPINIPGASRIAGLAAGACTLHTPSNCDSLSTSCVLDMIATAVKARLICSPANTKRRWHPLETWQ